MTDQERAVQRFKGQYLKSDDKILQKSKINDLPTICFRYSSNYSTRKLGAYGDKP